MRRGLLGLLKGRASPETGAEVLTGAMTGAYYRTLLCGGTRQ